MLSPNYPVLCFPLPYRVAPVFVQVVSPSLGWSPLSSFLVIWSPTGDTRGPSVVFEAVDMPCPGPFHFSYSVDYIYDFCPLPDPDVGLSVFVCDVEHTSFHFCLCGRKHNYATRTCHNVIIPNVKGKLELARLSLINIHV